MDKKLSEYWDTVASGKDFGDNGGNDGKVFWYDNINKRREIIKRLLQHDLCSSKILEIGVGYGTTAQAICSATLFTCRYKGTDVSKTFCEKANSIFGLEVYNTDIKSLPKTKDGYDAIFCFDILEHIFMEDRQEGYKELDSVMGESCTIYINNPDPENPTSHDADYDFSFTLSDLEELIYFTKTKLMRLERYQINTHMDIRNYEWIELQR